MQTTSKSPFVVSLVSALAVTVGVASNAAAEETSDLGSAGVKAERANSINVNPLGLAFGAYGLTYERLSGAHGVIVEANYAQSSDGATSASSGGAAVGYRWHWRGRQNSGFLGVNLGYQRGSGTWENSDTMEAIDLTVSQLSITGNIGKRWAWDNGLNLTFRIGAGYGNWDVSSDSTDPDVQEAVDDTESLLELLPVALDGELSLGYMF